MNRWFMLKSLLFVAFLLIAASRSDAGRTPSQRTLFMPNNGCKTDITVPYLITGRSTMMHRYVAPRMYWSPIVDDPKHPQSRGVYNLIFYGSRQGFGDFSNGAMWRVRKGGK